MTTLDNPSIKPAEAPGPGVYRNLPAETYHGLKLASASYLSELNRSPAHCREMMDHPKEPTDQMIFGTAVHLAVLQPELFGVHFLVADQCEATTQAGKRCSKGGGVCRSGIWFCGQHDPTPDARNDATILSQRDFDRALCVADSVRRHPAARELLDCRTDTEASAIWIDAHTSAMCKMRSDMLCGGEIVGDLKTTTDASREGFSRAVYDYGYYRQGAHYLRGLNAHNLPFAEVRFIAVETKAPFAVAVYRMSSDDLCRGIDELDKLLPLWQRCIESGLWPAYGDGVMDLELPVWAAKKIEQGISQAA